MFKKIFILLLVVCILNIYPTTILLADDLDTQTAQIMKEVDTEWISTTDLTTHSVRNGLVLINNQENKLRANGIPESQIQAQRNEAVSSLKDFAKATYEVENTGAVMSLVSSKETLAAQQGNLKKTESNFLETVQLGYKKAGLEKEATIGKDVMNELDQQAAVHYAESLPGDTPSTGLTLTPAAGGTYTLLAPIETFFPGGTVDVKGAGLGGYLNGLYRAGIAVATGLALIMIVVGGLEYVSTDSIQGKSNGRERIKNALIGLLLALTSFIILQQINPNLLKSDLQVESTGSTGSIDKVNIEFTEGISVASGPVTYANSSGQNSVSNTPYSDALINRALGSAGLPNTGGKCKLGPNGINTSGSKIKPQVIPNQNWSAYAFDLIKKSKLMQVRPSDAGSYFVGGQVTPEGWLLIIGGMIACESSFNPNTTYQEPPPPRGPGTLSVGLLQMSKEDPEARRKGYDSAALKDPYKNLEVGIGRLEALVVRDNCITCWTAPTGWRGGSAYWSVLRNK